MLGTNEAGVLHLGDRLLLNFVRLLTDNHPFPYSALKPQVKMIAAAPVDHVYDLGLTTTV